MYTVHLFANDQELLSVADWTLGFYIARFTCLSCHFDKSSYSSSPLCSVHLAMFPFLIENQIYWTSRAVDQSLECIDGNSHLSQFLFAKKIPLLSSVQNVCTFQTSHQGADNGITKKLIKVQNCHIHIAWSSFIREEFFSLSDNLHWDEKNIC